MILVDGRGRERTAEVVTDGHPDKFCDQVADKLVDKVLEGYSPLQPDEKRKTPPCRAAIEATAKGNVLFLAGEVRTFKYIDTTAIVREVCQDIGYEMAEEMVVMNFLKGQSAEIAGSVDEGGAGDQGIMCGYATDETPERMPLEYVMARAMARNLRSCRVSGELPFLRPDGKTQVTLDQHGKVKTVVIAIQHICQTHENSTFVQGDRLSEAGEAAIRRHIIDPVIVDHLGENTPRIVINGSGPFTIGGPEADAGTVGRKIVADAYGPAVPVGGGAFSGKDPTKVDRSAAYMARRIANSIVAAEGGSCCVKIAYAIGKHQPEMIVAMTGDGRDLSSLVKSRYPDLSPQAIAERLGLWKPQGWSYYNTAAFGHFGRPEFPWETPDSI